MAFQVSSLLEFQYYGVSRETVEQSSYFSILSIMGSVLIIVIFIYKRGQEKISSIREAIIQKINSVSVARSYLIIFLMILLSVLMWLNIWRSIGNFLPVGNRDFAGELFFISNHYMQILILSLSFYSIFRILSKRSRVETLLYIVLLIFLWYPFAVVGARKEIFLLVLCIFFFLETTLKQKTLLGAAVVVYMFGIPLLREGVSSTVFNILSIQEFILPQYTHLLLSESSDLTISEILDQSSYQSGLWVFIPGTFRLTEFVPLGKSFYNLDLTNVALGAHPIGEAWINYGDWGYFFFAFLFFFLIRFLITGGAGITELVIVSCSYLAVFGRSDLWITLFFIIYTSLFFFLLATPIRIRYRKTNFVF
ncbi:MAG: hypothetical protein KI790_01960 [Cyclobacteriaceae bacterium]|nr:hypothetical protein [Cyclobacteriaceae bacterium HetDA_MAG_MS6]